MASLGVACSSLPEDSAETRSAGDIIALRWLPAGADRAAILTGQPGGCETKTGDPATLDKRVLGKIAFESPALLGGAAARMGLSCASCHRNGRGNADFFLEGVSDKPGTADVTSSIFSKVRGDQTFNPVPIPDVARRDGKQIRDRTGAEFRAKVHGLVVEEFDGQEPPAPVFDALLAYLDGLAPSACAKIDIEVPLEAMDDLGPARAAYEAATGGNMDAASSLFYLRAARARLERLDERFVAGGQQDIHTALVGLSRAIEASAAGIRSGRGAHNLGSEFDRVETLARKHAAASLYAYPVMRDALAGMRDQ